MLFCSIENYEHALLIKNKKNSMLKKYE